jgi:Leucine-rich repeat (LRR) protein
LSGPIPESFGELKNLKELNLSSNNLKGIIPSSIGNLSKLEALGLFENMLEGQIPSEIGNLVQLKELVLSNNRLGGEIPPEFGQLASLQILQLQNNRFDSFNALQGMDSKQFLVFDTDDKSLSPKFKEINIDRTRMADTKFEDENENE